MVTLGPGVALLKASKGMGVRLGSTGAVGVGGTSSARRDRPPRSPGKALNTTAASRSSPQSTRITASGLLRRLRISSWICFSRSAFSLYCTAGAPLDSVTGARSSSPRPSFGAAGEAVVFIFRASISAWEEEITSFWAPLGVGL